MDDTPWYQRPDFLKLRKEWYSKLEDDGFEDVEIIDWSTGEPYGCMEGISQADVCNTYSPDKEEYYRLAEHWATRLAEDRPIRTNATERRVWELHSRAISEAKIGRRLGLSRNKVRKAIKRLREAMMERLDRGEPV